MDGTTRVRTAAAIGAGGAAVMAAIAIEAGGPGELFWADLPNVACAFVGATAAGLWLAPLFGRDGGRGVLRVGAGAVAATAAGAALGGAAALGLSDPVSGLVIGPVFVAASVAGSPAVAAVWAGSMGLAHLVARGGRGRAGGRLSPGSSGCP
jgi:hypothetical protein